MSGPAIDMGGAEKESHGRLPVGRTQRRPMLLRRTGAVCSGEIEISSAVSRNSATFGRQWQETGPVPAHTRTLRRPGAGACRRQRVSCFVWGDAHRNHVSHRSHCTRHYRSHSTPQTLQNYTAQLSQPYATSRTKTVRMLQTPHMQPVIPAYFLSAPQGLHSRAHSVLEKQRAGITSLGLM